MKKSLLLAFGLVALTGCSVLNQPSGKVLSVTTRGLYVSVSATDSTTGTPEVKLGLGSQTVTIVPTGTNGTVSIPNFTDSSTVAQTVNPFNASGSEVLAAGTYQVNQTNVSSASQPIVPK